MKEIKLLILKVGGNQLTREEFKDHNFIKCKLDKPKDHL